MILDSMRMARKPSLWLAIGIAAGAAMNDSALSLVVGVSIAVAPYMLLAADAVGRSGYRSVRDGLMKLRSQMTERPEPMSSSEYDRWYSYGELPERFRKVEEFRNGTSLRKSHLPNL